MAYRIAICDDSVKDAEFVQSILHGWASSRQCGIQVEVFHEGAVIQQGTHAELVADENGKYYELWHAQAQYYTEKTA